MHSWKEKIIFVTVALAFMIPNGCIAAGYRPEVPKELEEKSS